MKIGEKLRDYRHSMGWTQGRLAKKLWVNQCTISMIETGYREPGKRLSKRIATLLGIRPDEVWS